MNYRISDVKEAWLSDGIPYYAMDLPPEVKLYHAPFPPLNLDMLYIDNGAERLELMEVKHGFGIAPVIRLFELFHGKLSLSGATVAIPLTQKTADELLQDKQTLEKYIASQARRLKEINKLKRKCLIEQI